MDNKKGLEILNNILLNNSRSFKKASMVQATNDGCKIFLDRDNVFTVKTAKKGNYIEFTGSWTRYKGAEDKNAHVYNLGKVNIVDTSNQKQEQSNVAVYIEMQLQSIAYIIKMAKK